MLIQRYQGTCGLNIPWHRMLNPTQANENENLQRSALKIIFGHHNSYRQLIALSGLEFLTHRRMRLVDNFIRKAEKNEHFSNDWFPTREFVLPNLRHLTTKYGCRPEGSCFLGLVFTFDITDRWVRLDLFKNALDQFDGGEEEWDRTLQRESILALTLMYWRLYVLWVCRSVNFLLLNVIWDPSRFFHLP